MKLLIVISALCVAINALSDLEAWSEFRLKHRKTYQNKVEELRRLKIFQDNLRKIENHNAKYERGEESFYLAVNKFADMTAEEFASWLNKQISSKPKLNSTRFEHEKYTAPESVDWRSSAVSAVKDQGQCGSSWAFSATGALEGQLALNKSQRIPLSEQELIDCSTGPPYMNAGCNGGEMEAAFEYVQDHGISSDESYKYSAQDGICKIGTKVLDTISGYKIVASNENALQIAVGTLGPISVVVNADDNWQHYGGGIFDNILCTGFIPNQGVLAVGYDNAENKDYWIIKNSWGPSWGEDGFIRLVRGKKQCGIDKDGSYPVL